MKHAIIVTGGKQYRVAEGDVIFVEKMDAAAGEAVRFDRRFRCTLHRGRFCLRECRQERQERQAPRLQDEAQKGLSQNAGSQTALHQGSD